MLVQQEEGIYVSCRTPVQLRALLEEAVAADGQVQIDDADEGLVRKGYFNPAAAAAAAAVALPRALPSLAHPWPSSLTVHT
eukprot:2192323-Pleurochrysis_carterae.AAC.1